MSCCRARGAATTSTGTARKASGTVRPGSTTASGAACRPPSTCRASAGTSCSWTWSSRLMCSWRTTRPTWWRTWASAGTCCTRPTRSWSWSASPASGSPVPTPTTRATAPTWRPSPGTPWSAATPGMTRPPRLTRCTVTRTRARMWPGPCRPRCWPGSGPARASWWSCRSPRRSCTTSPTTCWIMSSTAASGASAATITRPSRRTGCSRARGRTAGSPSPAPPTRRSPR